MIKQSMKRLGRSQSGVSLPEAMIAMMLVAIATTSGITALASTKHATVAADRSAAMTRAAQGAIEDLRNYDYNALGMKANVTATTANLSPLLAQPADAARFNFVNNKFQATTTGTPVWESLVEPANGDSGENLSAGFDPAAPETVTGLAKDSPFAMKIWKFVTWRKESCRPDDTTEVCNNFKDTKRVTVAVRAANASAGNKNTVWLSTLVIDPSKSGAYVGNGASADAWPTQQFYLHDEACGPTAMNVGATYPGADHAPHNTSSGGGASTYAYCDSGSATRRPDLLSSQPPVSNTTVPGSYPKVRYSASATNSPGVDDMAWSTSPTRVYGYGGAGLAIQRSSGCPQTYTNGAAHYNGGTPAGSAYAPAGSESSWNIHTWSTNKIQRASGLKLRGRIGLVLFGGAMGKGANSSMGPGVVNYSSSPGSDGNLCISLLDIDTNANPSATNPMVIYSFYCTVNSWPEGHATAGGPLPDGMAGVQMAGARRCRFNPVPGVKNVVAGIPASSAITWPANGPYTVAQNHRLMLRVSSCGFNCDPGNGVLVEPADHNPVLFYDHENYPAEVDLATDQVLAPTDLGL